MALSVSNSKNESITSSSIEIDYCNNYSNNDSDSETDSFIKDNPNNNNSNTLFKSSIASKGFTSFEINNLKHTTNVFFVLFLIIVIISTISFASNPTITILNQSNKILEIDKSFLIPFNASSMKALVIITLLTFLIICSCLYSLFHQRMNVPEYQANKISNYLFILFSILTTICATVLCLYNQETFSLSIALGLADNMMVCFFMFFAVLTCLFSFVVLITFYDQNKSYWSNGNAFKSIIAFKLIDIGLIGVIFVICMLI